MLRTTLTAAALAVGAIAVPAQADSTVAYCLVSFPKALFLLAIGRCDQDHRHL